VTGRRFHIIAKPTGSVCNLDCTYCYYLSKAELLDQPPRSLLDEGLLERFIAQYLEASAGPEVVFTWQGGEPTLLGVPYFEKVVALQRRHARPGITVQNDLQTNGTLLDEDWARFLKDNDFLVGLSIDGPRALHDRFRRTKGGKPTFDAVLRSVELLHAHSIPFATLTCVNRLNAVLPREIYTFLTRELGSTRIQFLPVVEPRGFRSAPPGGSGLTPVQGTARARPGPEDSVVEPWSVDPDDWGRFLVAVFDLWETSDVGRVLVNWFETMVSVRLGLGAQMCVTHDFCGKNLAMEHDGSVYACDHFVYPEHRRGSIRESTLGDLAFDPAQVRFGLAKSESLPGHCRRCRHLGDCWGECPKNRFTLTPDLEPGLNYLCSGYRHFFGHAAPRIDALMARLGMA